MVLHMKAPGLEPGLSECLCPLASTNAYVEVLDGSRVHPEAYEWARKMAVDALEYDDVTEDVNPAEALEEILENPEKLRVRLPGLFASVLRAFWTNCVPTARLPRREMGTCRVPCKVGDF